MVSAAAKSKPCNEWIIFFRVTTVEESWVLKTITTLPSDDGSKWLPFLEDLRQAKANEKCPEDNVDRDGGSITCR